MVDGGDSRIGDRALIEDAVKLLLAQAAPGWQQLSGEFDPAAQPVIAQAFVTAANGQRQPLSVSAGVVSILAEHQRRSAVVGEPWRRLIVDCHADGRLSARTVPDATVPPPEPHLPAGPQRLRWLSRALMVVTVGCSTAAGVLFAVAWTWSPPPRADVIALRSPPPREREAYDVVLRWLDGKNRGDAAGMRAVACANPSAKALELIDAIEQLGQHSVIVFPDAFTDFNDQGDRVWATVALRARPLTDSMRTRVEQARKSGGFFDERFVLVDEAGQLKVCDDSD